MQEYQFANFPVQEQLSCRHYQRPSGVNTNKIHIHNAQEMMLITSPGRVRTVSNGVDFMVDTPAVIVNKQGAFHAMAEVYDGAMEGFVCLFHTGLFTFMPRENYEKTICSNHEVMILPLSQSQSGELAPLFEMMVTRSVGQKRHLLMCVFEYLKQLMEDGAVPVRAASKMTYIFEVARLLQDLRSRELLTVAALAERFHVSQTKLKTDFRKVVGMPLHGFRRQVQLQEARILLENTQQSLGEITRSCGFNDEGYFIRAFRQEYGMTPGQYRRQKNN